MKTTHKLIGLNTPDRVRTEFNGNYYATVEKGVEDWFHCAFDEKAIPYDRQKALFNMFKNSEDNLWSGREHKVVIQNDKIIDLFLDGI